MLARLLLGRQRPPATRAAGAASKLLLLRASTRGLLRQRRAYHHFTKEHGLAILRISSAAADVKGAIEDAERAWDATGTTTRPFLHVLHVHEPDRLAMEGPSPSPVPVVAMTAERNQLDIDLGGGEDDRPALVSLTRGPRRRPRPRRAPRTMEDLKAGGAAAAGGGAAAEHREEEQEDEDGAAAVLDEQSTATVVSVGLLVPQSQSQRPPEVVLFEAPDASFPEIPGRSLHELLADAEGALQPHTFLFANPGSFPLLELAQRLETVFHRRHVVASFTRASIQSERPRLLGLPAGGESAVVGGAMGGATDAPSPALGVAIFGGGLSTEQMADMTRALLGSSWLGNFALDSSLQRHLFVPSNFSTGPQPACERYQTEPFAEQLPLFRLQSVLYPGCSMLLKVFEPRYRGMIKHCLERQEPFGLVHADAAVGTLCYVSEIYQLDPSSGVSVLKVTGYRRFSLEAGTHVPPDSFGLLVANRAVFFGEEPPLDENEARELSDLNLQAEACLRLHNPEASLLPTSAAAKEGGEGDGPPSVEALVGASFTLCQYLIDHYGTGIPEKRKLEWLAGTATVDRMRDCLELLLANVRRGVGGAGGALAAARRAAEQGGDGGVPPFAGGRRGRGREQD